MNFRLVVWSFSCLVVLTKTKITPVNGISLSDFCCTLSAIAIMSKLTCHYPLNCCTFLSSGPAIARQKHRFFEPKKLYSTLTLTLTLTLVLLFINNQVGQENCFLCFRFHKIGSEGATALVTRQSGRLRTSRIVANTVQVSVQETLSYEGVILVFVTITRTYKTNTAIS